MTASYDKYDPINGGFRAKLAANKSATTAPIAVGLDSNGAVVYGAGNTGIIGVIVLPVAKVAGDVVDVMTSGEIVNVATLTAGTIVTADTTSGALGTTAASATKVPVGYMVEAGRLVVRREGSPTYDMLATAVVGDQSAVTHLTAATGTPSDTIADVGGSFTQATLNNNFKSIADKVNAILGKLESAGLLVP